MKTTALLPALLVVVIALFPFRRSPQPDSLVTATLVKQQHKQQQKRKQPNVKVKAKKPVKKQTKLQQPKQRLR